MWLCERSDNEAERFDDFVVSADSAFGAFSVGSFGSWMNGAVADEPRLPRADVTRDLACDGLAFQSDERLFEVPDRVIDEFGTKVERVAEPVMWLTSGE